MLGLLSNQIEDYMEEIIKKYDFAALFDAMVLSYKIGKTKPDISLFQEMLDVLNVKHHDCIFIDDQEKNILAAQKLGILCIHFENIELLRKQLRLTTLYFLQIPCLILEKLCLILQFQLHMEGFL